MTQKLTKALRDQKQQNKQRELEIYGSLGIPLGGQKLVEVPGRNSYVYVRLRDNQNEVIQAFNNKVATSYDLPVIVHREGSRYIVDGVNTLRYNNNLNNFAAYLPKHGQAHSFFPGGGGDVVWVYSRQMMPLLVYPSPSNTGTNVSVYGQALVVNNQWQYVGNTGTDSLLTYLPTGSDSVMGLIYLDARTGNPGILINSGTPFLGNITGTGDVMPYIPVPNTATQIPLAGVKLNSGTTTIGWNNLYDMREWVHAIPSGTSSGGAGSTGISGTFIQDEGIPKGFVTTLNFVGANVDASVSGSVGRVFVTGTASNSTPPFGGIPIYKNGVFIASGTAVYLSNNVIATASGTNVYMDFPVTTYGRVAQPTTLSNPTGLYWRVPEQVYATGSLGIFVQGHALIPNIDYTEQYPISGTYQYTVAQGTGSYHLAYYGIPCITTQTTLSANAITDSSTNLLTDSNGIQIVDSNGN